MTLDKWSNRALRTSTLLLVTLLALLGLAGTVAAEDTVPGAPQNLEAVMGANLVTLTWDPPLDDGGQPVESYCIYIWAEGLGWYQIDTTTERSYVHEGYDPGEVFTYSVCAENSVGEGDHSEGATPEVPHITAADFAGLSFEDTKGDDYTFCTKGEGIDETVLDSWGKKGEYSYVDIRSVESKFDEGTGKVSIEATFGGALRYGTSMKYYLCIVDSDHTQGSELLDPESVTGGLSWTFYDADHIYMAFYFIEDYQAGEWSISASPDVPSLEHQISSKSFEVEVDAADLEALGVYGGTGFGIYVYAHRLGSSIDDTGWMNMLSWDTAGTGAGTVPAEFNVEAAGDDETDGNTMLILVIIVVIVVVAAGGAFAYSRSKRSTPGEASPTEMAEEPSEDSAQPPGPS